MPIPLSSLQNPLPREVYFDKHFGLEATKLWPGEILATREDWLLVTVTGSCVVLCLHDPVAAVGGMAHFMVPDLEAGATDTHAPARYASHIMESLIDAMLLQGARRERLTALLYGGANILKGLYLGVPGERNVLFTRNYLSQEGIPLHDEAALGMTPRKIYFQPKRGRTKIRGIREAHNRTIFERELEYRHRLRELQLPHEGEVFDL